MANRRMPTPACWVTLALTVLLVYPLSYGPAAYLVERRWVDEDHIAVLYVPLVRQLVRCPYGIKRLFFRYSARWSGVGTELLLRAAQNVGTEPRCYRRGFECM